MNQKRLFDTLLLLLIVLVGAVLRLWDPQGIPMTHDELSAFYRLDVQSFGELIDQGVKEDGHPAGIQVFLWIWTRLFGTGDLVFKLPFLLMGIGSILMTYFLAKKWFNSTTGVLVAAFMATLQFPVMYSQMARPYISGLFFSLLMVWYWTRLLFDSGSKRRWMAVGFALSAVLCSYNHYFTMLFAFIVGVTGLIFLKRDTWKWYIGSLAAIIVLFLPHLELFLYQLGNRGLTWLGPPDNSFMLDYIRYIFHFSPFLYTAVALLTITGIILNRDRPWRLNRLQIVSIGWFITPVLVGFIYSKFIAPVVQFSVLIFSFPFLLFFLFSFYRPSSRFLKATAVVAILVVNISTLVWSRQHYDVFYRQPFREYALQTREFLQDHDPGNVTIIFQQNPEYIDHYFSGICPGVSTISNFDSPPDPVAFRNIIDSVQTDYLICGGLPLENTAMAREHYPELLFRDAGFTYEYYVFSREKEIADHGLKEVIFSSSLDLRGENGMLWHNTDFPVVVDTVSRVAIFIDSTRQWGPRFEVPLTEITGSRHDIIDMSVGFKCDNADPGLLVCEVVDGEKSVLWRSASLDRYRDPVAAEAWHRAYLSVRLTGLFKRERQLEDCTFKVYFWNSGKAEVLLDHFNIRVRQGNPLVYGLYEPIR